MPSGRRTADSTAIGQRMREVRERAGYTVEGLARLLETTAEAVEAWEASGDKMPLEVFYCFCQYLDASPDEILYGPGGPPPRAH